MSEVIEALRSTRAEYSKNGQPVMTYPLSQVPAHFTKEVQT